MTEEIINGALAFAIVQLLGIIILISLTTKKKTGDFTMKNPPAPPPKQNADPLKLLREDTYSNEEIDEITGHMHREQYRKENITPNP